MNCPYCGHYLVIEDNPQTQVKSSMAQVGDVVETVLVALLPGLVGKLAAGAVDLITEDQTITFIEEAKKQILQEINSSHSDFLKI